ncbi:MAG TPA: DUF2207 domain-containing protein [Anaerolineae bacterium]|jgi:uncharacterized membrane protein YgcG
MKLLRAIIVCAMATLSVVVLSFSPVAAASKTLEWTRLDSDITVQPNGDLLIIETNVINFTSGSFTFGYRDLDMSRLTDVTAIQVTEAGKALRIVTSHEDNNILRIKYYFTTATNQERTFKIQYTVHGATRYYNAGDQVYWKAVYADRNGYPVLNSRVTLRLPANAVATQATTYGAAATITGGGENTVTAIAQGAIDSGQELEIRVQFPHGLITGKPAAWQADFDKQRAYDETTKPTVDLIVLLGALVILLGGPALIILLWYMRGRDPDVGLIADYLDAPPPGVLPGVAGPLTNERADLKDVIATLVDLARRGVLKMTETGKSNRSGLVYDRDWVFERGPEFGTPLKSYESKLISAMDLAQTDQRMLSDLKDRIYRQIDGIKNALYDELVKDGFYTRSPASTRSRYSALGFLMLIVTGLTFCLSIGLSDYSNATLCIPIALGVVTIFMFVTASAMPARTRMGADARMRTIAFKKYLQNIEKYVDLKTATDQFDKYLPYAIAFGLDRTWINKFSAVNAPAPVWYVPYYPIGYGRGMGHSPIGGGVSASDIGGAAHAPVSLEGMDRSLSSGLTNMSAGLSAMFTSVATTFVSTPAPPPGSHSGGGGGWSGGGGGGGGGSGGGGGGFG